MIPIAFATIELAVWYVVSQFAVQAFKRSPVWAKQGGNAHTCGGSGNLVQRCVIIRVTPVKSAAPCVHDVLLNQLLIVPTLLSLTPRAGDSLPAQATKNRPCVINCFS